MKALIDPKTDGQAWLVHTIIGRSIVDAVWCDSGDGEYAVLLLDDGRLIEFAMWGTVDVGQIKGYPKSVRDRLALFADSSRLT